MSYKIFRCSIQSCLLWDQVFILKFEPKIIFVFNFLSPKRKKKNPGKRGFYHKPSAKIQNCLQIVLRAIKPWSECESKSVTPRRSDTGTENRKGWPCGAAVMWYGAGSAHAPTPVWFPKWVLWEGSPFLGAFPLILVFYNFWDVASMHFFCSGFTWGIITFSICCPSLISWRKSRSLLDRVYAF